MQRESLLQHLPRELVRFDSHAQRQHLAGKREGKGQEGVRMRACSRVTHLWYTIDLNQDQKYLSGKGGGKWE